MDETQPEPAAPAAGPAAAPPAGKSPASGAARVKAWGDAATALFKAMLLAFAILLVGIVSGVVVWRDQYSRVVVVEVSADAEKTLRALDADIDLRVALVDALNERLRGVQQIVAVQGLTYATDASRSDAISFKPFGLELSTGQITQMVDVVLDRPARPSARLELLCAPLACTDPAARQATLVVNLSGPNGRRNASYPVALGNLGLRRGLHRAVQRAADLMLEQNEPLIASVLFLNRASTQDAFLDQSRLDLIRAEAAAVAAARGSGASGCIADLVIGGSLARRGELADGVAAEQRAAAMANLTCKVHADTNVVFFLVPLALCGFSQSVRNDANAQVQQALSRLPRLRRGSVDDLVYFRIPAVHLIAEIVQVLKDAGGETVRAACNNATAPPTGPRGAVAGRLYAILHAQEMLPPDAPTLMQHQIMENLWWAMRAGVPRDDLAGRLSIARAMLDAVRRYQVNDPHPRVLFVLQGKLATEIARAAFEALERNPDEKIRLALELGADAAEAQSQPDRTLGATIDRNLNAAVVAFENAEATTVLAPLVEPVSDVQVLGLLGDAWYTAGSEPAARIAYARALDKFVDAGEPLEQVFAVADTLARWSSLRIGAGACEKDALPDPAWEDRWTRLGEAPHDVCRLAGPGAARPAALAGIEQLIGEAVRDCPLPLPPAPDDQTPDGPTTDWRAAFKRRVALIDCQRVKGAGDPAARARLSAEAVDAEIVRALGTKR